MDSSEERTETNSVIHNEPTLSALIAAWGAVAMRLCEGECCGAAESSAEATSMSAISGGEER
jgi:hypothetical protein